MSEPAPSPRAWVLPVLLAISTSAALGLGYLYLVRPNAGELGVVRVVVSDDDGKSANTIRVVVAEAPLVQKDTVAPGTAFSGVVHYPVPYLIQPNLKLTYGKRRYAVAAETAMGFAWLANPLPDDFPLAIKEDANRFEQLLRLGLEAPGVGVNLKPGLIFEDFAWEAKGLRAPVSALPAKTFEQKGSFPIPKIDAQESVVFFPLPYASPPRVELSGPGRALVVITECTAKSFKWRNVAGNDNAYVDWTATGVLAAPDGK